MTIAHVYNEEASGSRCGIATSDIDFAVGDMIFFAVETGSVADLLSEGQKLCDGCTQENEVSNGPVDDSMLCACGHDQELHFGECKAALGSDHSGMQCSCKGYVRAVLSDDPITDLLHSQVVGVKHDQDKDPWDLLMWVAVAEVVKVLKHGANEYAPDNWKHVRPFKRRFFRACMRHIFKWLRGEQYDPDSKLHHLAHAVCCLLFIVEVELEGSTVLEPLEGAKEIENGNTE